MNRRVKKAFFIAISAILFAFLFYRVTLGLNLILFELALLLFSFIVYKREPIINRKSWLFPALLLVSMSSVMITHTAFSIVVNLFIFLQTMAMRLWPEAAKIQYLALIAPLNALPALREGLQATLKIKKPAIFRKWPGIGLTLASAFIIWLFIMLYSASNSYFSELMINFSQSISDAFNYLFDFEHADILLYFLFGIIIASSLLIKTQAAESYRLTTNPGILLLRKSKSGAIKRTYSTFLQWHRTGILLLTILNVIIFIFNYLDIVHVWFFFEWNGQLLREFIHSGTWTLVFCIGLSAIVALAFFNGNIHFYSRNKTLKWLVKIWVTQNIIMTVSVLIRNLRYVDYYNLASLRIGVFIFLVFALFAMILLLVKINKGFNMFWLIKSVFVFSALLLVFTSAINWNRVIIKYNINHRDSGYFHYDYMVMMPDQTLDIMQENKKLFEFPYDSSDYHSYTHSFVINDSIELYSEIIDKRTELFTESMREKDWREWNFADWRALNTLQK